MSVSALDAANVLVSVRIKPSSQPAVFPTTDGVLVQQSKAGPTCHDGFGSIIDGNCGQADAFGAIAEPLLRRLRQGYSCTLLAYGQTGVQDLACVRCDATLIALTPCVLLGTHPHANDR